MRRLLAFSLFAGALAGGFAAPASAACYGIEAIGVCAGVEGCFKCGDYSVVVAPYCNIHLAQDECAAIEALGIVVVPPSV